jgi:hypothetical protein
MKSIQKGFIVPVIIFFVVALVAGGFYYMYTKFASNNNKVGNFPKPGWVLYQNNYGLPLFYPVDLKASEVKYQYDNNGNYKGADYNGRHDLFGPLWESDFTIADTLHPLLTTGFASEIAPEGDQFFFPVVFQVLKKDKSTLAYSLEALKDSLKKQGIAYGEVEVGALKGIRMPLPKSFAHWEDAASLYDDMWLFGDQYTYRVIILNSSGLSRGDIFSNTAYREISGQLTQDQTTDASQNASIVMTMNKILSYAGSLWAEDLLGKPGKQADACEGPLAPEFFRMATTASYLQSIPKELERGCNVSTDGWTALMWIKLVGKNSGYWCISVDTTSKHLSLKPPTGSVRCP